MTNIIVAYDNNRAIGKAGDLPWGRALPADLKRFKELTVGQCVIMGRKTYESIGSPLPDRENIIISRRDMLLPQGAFRVGGIAVALTLGQSEDHKTYIIGGSQIYTEALPYTEKIFATEVKTVFDDTDTFFPELNENEWVETDRTSYDPDNKNAYPYDFVEYNRIEKAAEVSGFFEDSASN